MRKNSRRLMGPGQMLTAFDFPLDAMSIRLNLPVKAITCLRQYRESYFLFFRCTSLNCHTLQPRERVSASVMQVSIDTCIWFYFGEQIGGPNDQENEPGVSVGLEQTFNFLEIQPYRE
jgi:hypothetical protein